MKTTELIRNASTAEELPIDLMGRRGNAIPAEGWAKTCSYIADSLGQYDRDNWEDYKHEIADALVPIYYKDKWQEMNDLCLWADDETSNLADEYMAGADESEDPLWVVVNSYLFAYYYNAINTVIDYIKETEGEEDSE
jgi:hypothetical protein